MEDGSGTRWCRGHRTAASLLVAFGVAATAVVPVVRPFTWQADLLVSCAIGLATCLALLGRPARTGRVRRTRDGADREGTGHPVPRARVAAWVALGAGFVAWELANVCLSPRALHPTVSSLVGSLSAAGVGRALAFLAWLGCGWLLVGR